MGNGRWESQGYFKPDATAAGEPFVIPMPPPNVTGALHMGHAMFVTLEVRVQQFYNKSVKCIGLLESAVVHKILQFGFLSHSSATGYHGKVLADERQAYTVDAWH